MRKTTDQLEMEKRIKEATRPEDPRQDFVESLWQKIKEQGSPSGRSFRPCSLLFRPGWLTLVNVIVLLSAVLIAVGPRNVYASIKDFFNFLDPGLQTVEAAGLVTDLGITSQPTILSPDSSIEEITVILDWVYIDEGRLVLGFITESLPVGLVLDKPTITADQPLKPDLTFSSVSGGDNADQIIFSAYKPIRIDAAADRVDFSVDISLIEADDPARIPLAIFHYDLEGIPVHKGQTYEMEQTAPAKVDDLEFQVESFLVTQSFSEVVFCSNLSAEKVLELPKSDINLQIGDGPVMYDYLVLELAEGEEQTCVQIGFLVGGDPEDERIVFRFKQGFVAIIQSATFSQDENIKKPVPKP